MTDSLPTSRPPASADAPAPDAQRRSLLHLSAGLVAAAQPGFGLPAFAAAVPPQATGRPGDFDFLSGRWKIANRRWRDGQWDEFPGEATVHGLLGGVASVEELRIPARNFSGMGLRLLDRERRLWADHWVNAAGAVLTPPPSWGSFVDGVGTWDSDDTDAEGKPIIVRGVWDRITADGCRWFQAVSRDDGRSWQEQWVMLWTRA
jgi:hypothetical protein